MLRIQKNSVVLVWLSTLVGTGCHVLLDLEEAELRGQETAVDGGAISSDARPAADAEPLVDCQDRLASMGTDFLMVQNTLGVTLHIAMGIEMNEAASSMEVTLQPLCIDENQCTLDEPVGAQAGPTTAPIDSSCHFTFSIEDAEVLSGASGAPDSLITATYSGDIRSASFMCGSLDGSASAAGSTIGISGSTFAAQDVASSMGLMGACP